MGEGVCRYIELPIYNQLVKPFSAVFYPFPCRLSPKPFRIGEVYESIIDKPNCWVIMKVCSHGGFIFAVLTRNEHCPPHVHVGTDKWDARFEFSFCDNSVKLWDVKPLQYTPTATQLEELRQVLKKPVNLKRARELWWISRQTLCLENMMWNTEEQKVVSPKINSLQSSAIIAARFDPAANKTHLMLKGSQVEEIQL